MVGKEKLPAGASKMLERMGKTLRKRGPDDQGEYCVGNAGLGATRLSIIDLPGGDQPLFTENKKVWVVQNGELYNYRELKSELENLGHVFSSQSDTETYGHAYEAYGLDFVQKLCGMYAVALWDSTQEQLVLVRDRLGIKPLYYTQHEGRLFFASELKALLATGIPRKLNYQTMQDYFAVNYVSGTQSIFEGVHKLAPGHMLLWKRGKIRIEEYWKPEKDIKLSRYQAITKSDQEIQEELLRLLKEAVKYHLVSDVPVGAFLSGGIDSSAVVALASQLYGQKLQTFSVGFKEKSFDELEYARLIVQKYATDHHEVQLELNPQELVEKIGGYFDEPFADSSAVGVYAISEVARKHVKVALSGDGGDEVFGGYVTYQADQLLKWYRLLPQIIREKMIANLVARLPASQHKMAWEFKAKRFVRGAQEDPLQAHFLWKAIFTSEQIGQLFKTGSVLDKTRLCERWWHEVFDGIESNEVMNKFLYTDMKTSLVWDMLTKVDRMSMANSLEVRVPLLDHKLVEFMLRLPSRHKVQGLTLKVLLKQALYGIVPQGILQRPKAGFHVPVAQWIKGELRDVIGDYLSPARLKREGYFDPQFVQGLVDDHLKMRADYSREIWGLLMFEIWRENYL